jgi:ligand-binding SRPBCC domain-containing protein
MRIYKREWKKEVPRSLDEVWGFFSRPENLNEMTPKDMSFEILSDIAGKEMYEGMMILYKVSPLLGIKMRWATEITHIKPKQFFVDEQRSGPFAMWHHEHHFEETEGGVLMTDLLHYAAPLGPLGILANTLFVGSRVEEIFRFRDAAVDRLFPKE